VSKNYEVLRQAGKDLAIFWTGVKNGGGSDLEPSRGRALVPDEPHHNGNGRVRSEILRLIQRTFLTGTPGAPRSVVLTAVDHGSGCSWVCAQIAEALAAHVDGTVCVVEASLHAPSIHRYFAATTGSGLADAWLRQGPVHDFALAIRGTNLWLLAGPALPSQFAGGGTAPTKFESRFAEICSEFTYVLVDAPPINESAESLAFCRMADGVILVLEADNTRREAARRAKEMMEASNIRLLGAVLNKRTFPIPQAIYSRV
jgi:polysaccharide biosynthesis transport protein